MCFYYVQMLDGQTNQKGEWRDIEIFKRCTPNELTSLVLHLFLPTTGLELASSNVAGDGSTVVRSHHLNYTITMSLIIMMLIELSNY